jgi:predicted nucleic acid-binding protein
VKLFVDANMLVRCVAGLAWQHADALRERGVALAVTERQVKEALSVLIHRIGMSVEHAEAELFQILLPFELVPADEYRHQERAARARLVPNAGDDWHCLAGALALDSHIWTSDRDFFGVGVPVWSTANLRHLAGVGHG